MKTYLEFERDIKALEEEVEKLKDPFNKEGLSQVETDKISRIQEEIDNKLKLSYKNLNELHSFYKYIFIMCPKIINIEILRFFIYNLIFNQLN